MKYKVEKTNYGVFISQGDHAVCRMYDELAGTETLAHRICELLNASEDSILNQIRELLKKDSV